MIQNGKSNLFKTARLSVSILAGFKSRFLWVLILNILVALFEVANIGLIFPFLTIVVEPEIILKNFYSRTIFEALGFSDINNFVLFFAFLIFLFTVAVNLLILLKVHQNTQLSSTLMKLVPSKILESYLMRPILFFGESSTGELSKNIIEQADIFALQVVPSIINLISDGIAFLFLVLFLLYLEPAASIALISIVSLIILTVFHATKEKINSLGKLRDTLNSKRFKHVITTLEAVKEIKIYRKEKEFIHLFYDHVSKMAIAHGRLSRLQVIPSTLVNAFVSLIAIALAIYFFQFGSDLSNAIPILGAYIAIGYRLMPSAIKLIASIGSLKQNAIIVDSVHNQLTYLDGKSDAILADKSKYLQKVPTITFRNVSFAYPNSSDFALDGISISFAPNSLVCVVGPSGSGKTTLIDLMLGLLEPNSGAIYFDDRSLSQLTSTELDGLFGYVHQSPLLLDGTIAENIAFGVKEDNINLNRLDFALNMSELNGVLNKGVATRIGERGAGLSGGQRQRVAIGRALYTRARVLVFDESTNALDRKTEQNVVSNLVKLKEQCTVFTVAHNTATMMVADNIIMVDAGRVVAQGRYHELMETSEKFRDLMAHRQFV